VAGKAIRIPSPGPARQLNLVGGASLGPAPHGPVFGAGSIPSRAAAQVAARKGTAPSSHAPLAPIKPRTLGAH
jgi:hypothetical protein